MKIVLSRKGFDSGSGGVPNPIMPDGRLVSLPIPSRQDWHSYDRVGVNGVLSLGQLVEDLTRGRIKATDRCHLDPDLDEERESRPAAWRPAFGQASAAQRHLVRHGVGEGDLFLFFGWFRQVEQSAGRWRFNAKAPNLHVLYGWMRIGGVFDLANGAADEVALAAFADHPHIRNRERSQNALYVAAERLNVGGRNLSGGGLFRRFAERLVLTDIAQSKRSRWKLPGFFHPDRGAALTYNTASKRWDSDGENCILNSAARGQEFVLSLPRIGLADSWLATIFAE